MKTRLHKLLKIACPAVALSLLLNGCSQNDATFSSFPGFEQYFIENKPSPEQPSQQEQQLLMQYRPRFFMADGQTQFIDFYQDYIAHGELHNRDGLISKQVDSHLLNRYRDDFSAEFRYIPTQATTTPVVYGRIDYDELIHDEQRYPLSFLSYNLVFAHSGLLKGLPGWQNWFLENTGWHKDWHQLDHYVGLSVVLYQNQPLAVMLQQHNYQTTYIANHPGPYGISWPADQRVQVDIALQSNELYPHNTKETRHPGVSFVSADNISFMKTGKNKPVMAGYDITQGQHEQNYTLKFLPTADAFYSFKGRLGEKRSLPGRDGPPGANYVTLPGLMPLANRLVSGFRPGDVEHERQKLQALFDEENFMIRPDGLTTYREDFIQTVW